MIARLVRRLAVSLVALALGAGAAAAKPLVAILAEPEGTVATDLLGPYAILAESGAVDVRVVSPTSAPFRLLPGHAWAAPQMTLAELARLRPHGPDAIIVPAMHDEDDPQRAAWLRDQARRGVRIMSICNGGLVLAEAGLLDGRQATVHWYSRRDADKKYPKVAWRQDVRWITDGRITTSSGISAAEPASLQLLRELAGDETMRRTAQRLRLPPPDPRHAGADYRLTPRGMGLVVANRLAFWSHEDVAIPLTPGFDELAFGTALDAWSRTYRSTALTFSLSGEVVASAHGIRILPDNDVNPYLPRIPFVPDAHPADALEETLKAIADRYGARNASVVAMQLEYPWTAGGS